MYYKVVGETIRYIDEIGQERRANPGSIVNIEQRMEAKRLKKEGRIVPLDGTEEVGSDFVIREKFTDGEPGEKGTPSKDTTSHTETQQGAKESLTPGVVVQAGDVFGEVVKVTPKTVLVKLDGEEKEKRFKKEEVEVIG